MRGWVYVITNKAMPGLVKIGYSTKDPSLRAADLDNTGAPFPYVVQYDALVHNPRDIERRAHLDLSAAREGKEWFRCSLDVAILAIRRAIGDAPLLETARALHFTRFDESPSPVASARRRERERTRAQRFERARAALKAEWGQRDDSSK